MVNFRWLCRCTKGDVLLRYSGSSIIQTLNNTNSWYIELKSVSHGFKTLRKTLDMSNSRSNEVFTDPLKVLLSSVHCRYLQVVSTFLIFCFICTPLLTYDAPENGHFVKFGNVLVLKYRNAYEMRHKSRISPNLLDDIIQLIPRHWPSFKSF